MKKLKLSEATASLAEYTRALNEGPLVVTAHGKPIAALVPIEGVDLETLAVGTNPQFLDLIERSQRRMEAEGGISSEEMHHRLGIPLPEDYKPSRKARKPSPHKQARKDGRQV